MPNHREGRVGVFFFWSTVGLGFSSDNELRTRPNRSIFCSKIGIQILGQTNFAWDSFPLLHFLLILITRIFLTKKKLQGFLNVCFLFKSIKENYVLRLIFYYLVYCLKLY